MNSEAITPQLIQACQKQDEAACSQLFETVAPSVFRLAYSLLLNRQDAEDVLQEAMVYIFRNLHQYDPQRGAFHTWVYTITVSRSRNARRRKWFPTIELGELLNFGLEPSAPEEEQPETLAVLNEASQTLWQALNQLSPRLREAVVLRYMGQMSYKEIGLTLNIPEKTAESRVRLAQNALRQTLQAEEISLLSQLLPS